MCKPLPCAPHWQNKPNLWAPRPTTPPPPTLHTPTHHSGTRGGGAPAKLPYSICLTNTLHGGRLRESGSGVVTGQLYFSCVNMKYAEKNESNIVASPSVQFNVAPCLVVLRSHTFFSLSLSLLVNRISNFQSTTSFFITHISMGKTLAGLLTFMLCWIFYVTQLYLTGLWSIHSGFSSGCSSGRMGAWRSSMWRERMKAGTPASPRTTGAKPTARALCRLQASPTNN